MKFVFLFLLIASCASAPQETAETPITEEGALDKAMKNKDCGIFDVMYDGCKQKRNENNQDQE